MQAAQDAPATGARGDRASWRAWAALAALSLGGFTFLTTELLPIGLLTSIAGDMDRSVSIVGLLVSGYAVVVVIVSVPLTALTRTFARRTLLMAMLAALALAAAGAALAPSYGVLLGARLVTALTQALFWAVVGSAAVHLFPAVQRGRALSALFMGISLGPVLGVPAGTWLGERYGWRVAFVAVSVLALLTCAAVTALLPNARGEQDSMVEGDEPNRRRYAVLVVVTAIAVTGSMSAYTYVTPFLLDVTGYGRGALAALLSVSGVAGFFGAMAVGPFLGRHSRKVIIVALSLQSVTLGLMFGLGDNKPLMVVALALLGGTLSALAATFASRALTIAPGRTDMASAGMSSAYNVGIAAGSFLGGRVVDRYDVRQTALLGLCCVGAALLVALCEPALAKGARSPHDRPLMPPA